MSFKRHPYLKSNTVVNIHSVPYITGVERKDSSQQFPNNMDSSNFLATIDAEFRWAVEQEDGTVTEYEIMGVGSGITPILTLDELIVAINAEQTNTNSPVLASEVEGSLRLTLQIVSNSNPEKAIRILPAASYSEYIGAGTGVDLSYTLGFQRYPHPNSVVSRGEISPTAHRPNSQQNEPLSTFLAIGEDRLSENINRALYSMGRNLDDADTRLRSKVAVPVQLVLARTSPRLIYNNYGYVTHINLGTAIGDNYDSLLLNRRVFIYDFENSSFFVSPENKHFAITDKKGQSIPSWSINTLNNISHDVDAVSVAHVKENISPSYPTITASNADKVLQSSISISSISSNTVIRCDGADFSSVKPGDKVVISGSSTLPYSNDGEYVVGQIISTTEIEILPIDSNTQEILNLTTPLGDVVVSTGSHWRRDLRLELSPAIPRIPLTVGTNTEERDPVEDDDAIILHLYLEYDLGEGEVGQHVIPSASDRPEMSTPVDFKNAYLGENERYADAGGVLTIARRPLSLMDDGWRSISASAHDKTPNISGDSLDHDFDSTLFGTNEYQGAAIVAANILRMPYNGTTITDSPQFSRNLVGSYIRFDNTSFPPASLASAFWDDVPLECRLAIITEYIDSAHVRIRPVGGASNTSYPIGTVNYFDLLIHYSPQYTPSALELKSLSDKIAISIIGDEERGSFGITDSFFGADAASSVKDDPSTPILCLKRLNLSNTQGMWGSNTTAGQRAWVRNVRMRTDNTDNGWVRTNVAGANFLTSGIIRSWNLIDNNERKTNDSVKSYLGDSTILAGSTAALNVPGTVVRIVSDITGAPNQIKDGFYRVIDIEEDRLKLGDLLTGTAIQTTSDSVELYCSFYSITFAVGLHNTQEMASRGIHSFVDFSSLRAASQLQGTAENLPPSGGSVFSLDWRGHGSGLYATLNMGSTADTDILSYPNTALGGIGDLTSGYFIQGEIKGPAAGIKLNTMATRGVDYRNYSPGIDVYSQTFSTDYQESSRSFSGSGKFASYTARFQQIGCDPNLVLVSGEENESTIHADMPGANLLLLSPTDTLTKTSGLWSNSSLYVSSEVSYGSGISVSSETNGLLAMDSDAVLRTGTRVIPTSGVRPSKLGSADIYRYYRIGETTGRENPCTLVQISDADYTQEFKNVKHSYIVELTFPKQGYWGADPNVQGLKVNLDKSCIGLKIAYEGTNITTQNMAEYSNTTSADDYSFNYKDSDTIVGIKISTTSSAYGVILACLTENNALPSVPSSVQISDIYIFGNRYRQGSMDLSDGSLVGTWSYLSAADGDKTYRSLRHNPAAENGVLLKDWDSAYSSQLDSSYSYYPLISRLDFVGLYYGEDYNDDTGRYGSEGGRGYQWLDSSRDSVHPFGILGSEDLQERFVPIDHAPVIEGISIYNGGVFPLTDISIKGPGSNAPSIPSSGPHSKFERWAVKYDFNNDWQGRPKLNDSHIHPDTDINRLVIPQEKSTGTPGGHSEFNFEDAVIHPINTFTETQVNYTPERQTVQNTRRLGAATIPSEQETGMTQIHWGDPYADSYWLEMHKLRTDGGSQWNWSSYTPSSYTTNNTYETGPFNPHIDASYDTYHRAMRIGIHCDHKNDGLWEIEFCKFGPRIFNDLNYNYKLQLQVALLSSLFVCGNVEIKPCLYYRTANFQADKSTKIYYKESQLIWEDPSWTHISNVSAGLGFQSISFDITKGALDSYIKEGELSSSFHTAGRVIMALKIKFNSSGILLDQQWKAVNEYKTNFLLLRVFELINHSYPMVIDGNLTVTGSLSAANIGLNQYKKGSQTVGPMDVGIYTGTDISDWSANPANIEDSGSINRLNNEGSRPYPQGYGRLKDITGTWIKPVYEGNDFFRKDVQGAVINLVHPYHDPAYYMWVAKNVEYFMHDTQGSFGGSQGEKFAGLFNYHYSDADNYRLPHDQDLHKLTYEAPEIGQASTDRTDYDWSNNLILPGPTGFTIPLDPPHGAKLTSMSWNVFNGVGLSHPRQTGSLDQDRSSYCFGAHWAAMPSNSSAKANFEESWATRIFGTDWAKSKNWDPCVGFRVSLYRFNLMGEENFKARYAEGTDYTFTPEDQGGPELIWTTISTLRDGDIPDIMREATNGPARNAGLNMRGTCKFYNYDTYDFQETTLGGGANANAKWSDEQEWEQRKGTVRTNDGDTSYYNNHFSATRDANLIVDRERYSYFATITFYGGSRIPARQGRDTFSYAYEYIPESVTSFQDSSNGAGKKAKISDTNIPSSNGNIGWYDEAGAEHPTDPAYYGDTEWQDMIELGADREFSKSFFPHNVRDAGSSRPCIMKVTSSSAYGGDAIGNKTIYANYGLLHLGLRGKAASTYELGKASQDVNPSLPKVIFKGFKLNWKSNK